MTIFTTIVFTLLAEVLIIVCVILFIVHKSRTDTIKTMCNPRFQKASDVPPQYGWVWMIADTKKLHFKDSSLEVCETKEQAEFRRRCFGMLSGCIKLYPCEIRVLDEEEK